MNRVWWWCCWYWQYYGPADGRLLLLLLVTHPLQPFAPATPTCPHHRTWILRFLCTCQEASHLHSSIPTTPVLFAGQQRGLRHQKNRHSFHPRKKRHQERNQTLVHVKIGIHHSILCVLLRWTEQKHVHRNGARQWW